MSIDLVGKLISLSLAEWAVGFSAVFSGPAACTSAPRIARQPPRLALFRKLPSLLI
ncbi:hypothetical protein IBT47_16800 [Erwinia sp. S43]|uniref:hypothetical protein n=1 Tax=Erwinia sp. S43 TaxID=2769339 RepID=UPI00190B49B2|nr:hypothetical protein [Erwinia sp. S43]MBK0033950.1 hypothetical protein [Erwinia sp. S43]